MEQKNRFGTILYLTAFVLWLFFALTKYTYFKDMLPVKEVDDAFFCVALALLLAKIAFDFRFNVRNVIGLFFLILFMTIACAGGKFQFAVMFALVFCATGVPLSLILRTSLISQIALVLITVTASQIGVLEDYIWEAATRQRHGFGFTHSMLVSHFGLYISLIYIALVKKMTVLRALVIFLGNGIIYFFTDGRTDMYLSVLFIMLAFLFGNLGDRLKYEKVLGKLATVLPFALCAISIILTIGYSINNSALTDLNHVLNGRLSLGLQAMKKYGFPLFGRKILWVGLTVVRDYPSLAYNYVDNAYLMMIFTYGIIFVSGYCLAMAWLLYDRMKAKDTMIVVCLVITLAFGVINPQSMYLTYNPFLVLLAGFWNPEKMGRIKNSENQEKG